MRYVEHSGGILAIQRIELFDDTFTRDFCRYWPIYVSVAIFILPGKSAIPWCVEHRNSIPCR